ncbi:hypothetical protein GGD66_004008 [Bradyrhizobium sp. CIR48]|uniref:hypothetical protein n=1 Tax=unclassified Bradyrhizobium TaxID=2631580 RepID=UPI00179F5430|nr:MULTISPECIES: hypothetical protein [unclassified Bradyrhizobium]MBB4366364.1 hypothetical protein [Bradyrhizobium sp. CIR18]MBB4425447.1 hypothetical protein [Bradyrhizobium sp. CIR48]
MHAPKQSLVAERIHKAADSLLGHFETRRKLLDGSEALLAHDLQYVDLTCPGAPGHEPSVRDKNII